MLHPESIGDKFDPTDSHTGCHENVELCCSYVQQGLYSIHECRGTSMGKILQLRRIYCPRWMYE